PDVDRVLPADRRLRHSVPQEQREGLLDLGELRADLSVEGAVLGLQHTAARGYRGITLDDPLGFAIVWPVGGQPVLAHRIELAGVDLDGHPWAAVDLLDRRGNDALDHVGI